MQTTFFGSVLQFRQIEKIFTAILQMLPQQREHILATYYS